MKQHEEENRKLSVGNVVTLRSGGPTMTVSAVITQHHLGGTEEGWVMCLYTSDSGDIKEQWFPKTALVDGREQLKQERALKLAELQEDEFISRNR